LTPIFKWTKQVDVSPSPIADSRGLTASRTEDSEPAGLSSWLAKIRPFGMDLFCLGKKFLVFNLVGRNLKIKYRRSALGILWTLVAPTALACVYYFVFVKVVKIQMPHYLGFILSGIFLWTFFARTVVEGTESLVGNITLLTKIPIPLQIFPFVTTVTNFSTLLLSLPVLFTALAISGVPISATLVLFPVYLALLFMMAYGFALILALGFVYFRDLKHVMEIVMQVWFYGTPVLFDAKMIPENYHWVLYANPTGLLFHHLHLILIQGVYPPVSEAAMVVAWTAIVVSSAGLFYRRAASGAVEVL
jgi:lipopolysaccharide transport system permease protein